VTIFIDERFFSASPIEFSEPNIEVVCVSDTDGAQRPRVSARQLLKKAALAVAAWQHWRLPRLGCHGSVDMFVDAYAPLFGPYVEAVSRRIGTRRFGTLIGVEALGLIVAYHIREAMPEPQPSLIYFNLELLQHEEQSVVGLHNLKHAEILASRRCALTVIADEHRGRVFREANGIPEDRVRYLPVGTSGEPVHVHNDYWHRRFPIPRDCRVILYAGNIQQPWAMTREVIESVTSWPANCVLVLHTWREKAMEDPYLQSALRGADARRVFVSTQPVPPGEVPAIIAAADIGLAFYRAHDANFSEIGASSNKLAQYARAGLPVIANRLPSIERVFARYGNGVAVDDPSAIGQALQRILAAYDRFRSAAFGSYDVLYNAERQIEPLYPLLIGGSGTETV
jgi:glycosyltransferase involved in cell wall biosynthesis